MFVRRKKNRSGSVSVVVVDKSRGRFKELATIGVARDEDELRMLERKAHEWIFHYGGQQLLPFEENEKAAAVTEQVISNITSTRLCAPQTIIGKVYDRIGFGAVADEELRHLVTARICQPMSKRATVDYLRRHFKDDVSLQKIYRYLDKLHDTQKELVLEISVRHTKSLFGGSIGVLFYDVTTLYFETARKDDLRNNGFSKDGKNSNPQVVLGLLVSRGGYPLSYSLFNGAQFEGYTMLPIVDDFIQRHGLGNDFVDIPCPDGDRLIVGYSEERARKNRHDREEGVERLRRRYAKGSLTKADINKRGYNKFLEISSGVTVRIDESRIAEDAAWDGLKGYKTNTSLAPAQVYEEYSNLWHVERAFRITKGTLDIRPMFHFTERRIEAHVCICFVALKVYKELERLLKKSGCPYSIDDVLKIAETIVTLDIAIPDSTTHLTKSIYTTGEEKSIAHLIETNDWLDG